MDTAGKAVLFSGVTVLISLSAVMLVPSPAFRSMALGIMLSVLFVLAATLTLLPAVLAKLGPKVDALPLKWVHSGEHRSPRVRPLGRAAVAAPAHLRPRGDARPLASRPAGAGPEDGHALDQGRAEAGLLAGRLRAGPAGVRRRCPRHPANRRPPAERSSRRERRSPRHRDRVGLSRTAGRRRARPHPGDPERRPVEPGRRPYRRPAPVGPAGGGARRRRVGREPRPRAGARREDAARDRSRARARLPAPARRACRRR